MRLKKLRGAELTPYLDEALQILLLEEAIKQIGIHFQPCFKRSFLTAVAVDPEMKFLKAFSISSFSLVVLKSLEDDPSLFFTPSIRNPSVAVEEMVSRHTMYLHKFRAFTSNYFLQDLLYVIWLYDIQHFLHQQLTLAS